MSGAIVFDECLAGLVEASLALNEYVEIDAYMSIYEADNPKVKEQEKNNAEASEKVTSGFKKAIDSLLSLIKRISDSIKDLFQKLTMGKDEKDAFEKFREACKQDPELKNKKVTVNDFKQINASYDALLKEVEDEIRAEKAGKETDASALVSKVTKFVRGGAKLPVVLVTASVAQKAAADNRYVAKMISNALNEESEILRHLEESMGEKKAKKFKRDMKSMGRLISLHRAKVHLLHGKSNHLGGAIMKTKREVQDLLSGKVNKGNAELIKNAAGSRVGKAAIKTVGGAAVQAGVDTAIDNSPRMQAIRNMRSKDARKTGAMDYIFGQGEKNIEAAKAEKKAKKEAKKQARKDKKQAATTDPSPEPET